MMQELEDDFESRIFNKYCWSWSETFVRQQFVCVCQQRNLVQQRHSISTLEPITGRKSETAIPHYIDGSRRGKTIRWSRYSDLYTSCLMFLS